MPANETGELGLPARAALVVERIADGPQVGGGHAASEVSSEKSMKILFSRKSPFSHSSLTLVAPKATPTKRASFLLAISVSDSPKAGQWFTLSGAQTAIS